MSKINAEGLREAVDAMLAASKEKKRNFTETVELQIGLKGYDTTKDKRFSGTVKLPALTRKKLNVCVLGDQVHVDQCAKLNIECKDVDYLKTLNRNKKLVKKLADSYDAFLASETVVRQIPRLLGPGLTKAGKFPQVVTHDDNLEEKINELQCTVKFQLKKVLCMGTAIGFVDQDADTVITNILIAVNFLVSLLKKNWQNVRSLHIKTTMGKSFRVY